MQRKSSIPNLIAFGWGLAEATVFFIVPDVYIGYRGLKGARRSLVASFWALGGALIGGIVMYTWASRSGTAMVLVRDVPAITTVVIQMAHAGYVHHGTGALFIGMAEGVPYKVYSVLAPSQHIALLSFLLVSMVARTGRFVAVGLITAGLSKLLSRWFSSGTRLGIFIGFWLVFYAFYFAAHL